MWSPKALSVLWMPRQSALMCYTLLIPWSGYASHRSMQCMCVMSKRIASSAVLISMALRIQDGSISSIRR